MHSQIIDTAGPDEFLTWANEIFESTGHPDFARYAADDPGWPEPEHIAQWRTEQETPYIETLINQSLTRGLSSR